MTTLAAVEQQQNLTNLIETYLTSCRIEVKSDETVRSYRETLGVSPITQWRRQRETRTFFSWLLRHDYIPANPFAKVKNIKVPQKIIHPFSQDDVLRLLACCDPATRKAARGRALILALLDTGLRAGELASLQLEDVDFHTERIQVRNGKGNKQRVVRIGERAGEAVHHYLEQFRGFAPGALFLICRGQPLCRSAMRTIFQRLGREASVPKVHPHRFRHTFATCAIEQQAREIDVQFLLGHAPPLHRHLRRREGSPGPCPVQPRRPPQWAAPRG
jgi:site-specific recombinase XerD